MDLKTSATRIFGWLALIVGAGLAASTIFLVSLPRTLRPWELGVPFIIDLLFILVAANLIYVGWHSVAHSTIPIRPRALFHKADVLRLRERFLGMCATRSRAVVSVLFAGCSFIGAEIAISYAAHLRPSDDVPWLLWLLEFPCAMACALAIARISGCLHRLRLTTLIAAVGVLVAANVVALLAFVTSVAVVWMLAYIPALVVNALFIALAQALLNEETHRASEVKWTRYFARLLWAGIPIGLSVGILLCYLSGRNEWVIPSIQMTWAAMIGISTVPEDARVLPSD